MKTINNYLHDIERFGYTPKKLYSRLFVRRDYLPKILSVSVPKSGTNLLQRILTLHPMLYRRTLPTLGRRNRDIWADWDEVFRKTKPGEIVSSHFDYDSDLESYLLNNVAHKIIFTARDPRDVVISDMYYILKRPDHGYYSNLSRVKTEKERLAALIRGEHGMRSIEKQINRFTGWINHNVVYVKFEDMIGDVGGGNDILQRDAIKNIYTYLGMEIDDKLLSYIAENCRSSKSQTFRKGTINNWKGQFDGELKDMFKEVAGDLLIQMGYEKDHSW